MTAVRPVSQFNIIKESTREGLTQRACHKVSVVADVNEQTNEDSEDAGFCGEPFADNGELLSSLSPLLFSMKLFGVYFHRENRQRTGDPEWNPGTTAVKACNSSTKLRVYATIILIIVWLNAVRFASVFTRKDHFGDVLLMKIAVFTFCVLAAIFQTTYYYASHTGQLLKILLTLPVTRDCVRGAHRAAVFLTVLMWITAIGDMCGGCYIFFTSYEKYNFILAPFVTYIYLPKDNIEVAIVVGYLGYMAHLGGVFFAQSMNQLLVYIFYSQFKKLKKNFRRALGERGQFNGDLSLFRRRHK